MLDLSELIINLISIFVLIMCVFVAVHVSIQFKNYEYLMVHNKAKKPTKSKLLLIIILSVSIFALMYFKIINNYSSYKTNTIDKSNYQETVANLNDALSLEFSTYGEETYSTAEDIARSLYKQLPIKKMYYVGTEYEMNILSRAEIIKYKLEDFQNKPTLISYDGMLLSLIKFQNGCSYVNTKQLGKSDCIIEVDVNHYEEPNQIGKDRVLMAIDATTNTIKTDSHFFK